MLRRNLRSRLGDREHRYKLGLVMGEAKRRAKLRQEHTAERVPFHRGLVLRPPYTPHGATGVSITGVDTHELHLGLLYWDKIANPINNIIRVGLPDEHLLEREGVLIQPRVQMNGTFPSQAEPFIAAHVSAYEMLEKQQPGKWALSHGERPDLIKNGIVGHHGGSLVEIVKALPMPAGDVPIETILDFRAKRRPELLRLRLAIDAVYDEVSRAEDKQSALRRKTDEIELACLDLIRVSKERWKLIQLSDLQTIFNGAGFSAVAEAIVHSHMPAVAAALGVVGTLVKVSNDVGLRRAAVRNNPYWYIAKFHSEILR